MCETDSSQQKQSQARRMDFFFFCQVVEQMPAEQIHKKNKALCESHLGKGFRSGCSDSLG